LDTQQSNAIFTSHEGLLLPYEECFVREIDGKYYATSSHFLWIGERTNNINEAHVEFFRGIENPIGIKVSTRMKIEELIEIIKKLNPSNEEGKIVLITRFGVDNIKTYLESLCSQITQQGLNVLFMCDPNHGNTKLLNGFKTRYFDDLKQEILETNTVLVQNGCFLSGIHLEASCFNVTECIGGLEDEVKDIDGERYTTYCDPRLNIQQVMIY
jgi:3-deoxy-7-phosphoheptulonate synthase